MSDKPRFPRADALAVVRSLLVHIAQATERVIIAGSLRRRKETVGDIEFVYIPKVDLVTDPQSLFGEKKQANLLDHTLDFLIAEGVLAKRENKLGRTAWGDANKLAIHTASGIPVDFFATTPESWFNYLVCRTGGAESNTAIASAALNIGWKWNPYGPGFERRKILGNPLETRTVHSEQEVFNFVGLPYLEPWERQ